MISRYTAGAAAALLLIFWVLFSTLPGTAPRKPRHRPPVSQELAAVLHLQWMRELPRQAPTWPDQPRYQQDLASQPVVGKFLKEKDPEGDPTKDRYKSLVFLTCSQTDSVLALDTDTGEEKWRFSVDGPVRHVPAVWEDRVYFVADDGYLYCVDGESGTLAWRFRGGPSDRKVLGNERLISTWPARGGPIVVEEPSAVDDNARATVYFAAGIWPFMGIFLHALDATTGEVIWTNDGDGSQFIKQPHRAEAFAGIAPQGSLVVSGNTLLVPGGRSIPACYDRRTGKQLHYRLADNSNLGGGPDVQANNKLFLNGGGAFDLGSGEYLGKVADVAVLTPDRLYACAANQCREFDIRQQEPPAGGAKRTFEQWLPRLLTPISLPKPTVLAKFGNRLYGGRAQKVFAVDLPLAPDRPPTSWEASLEGQPTHLAAGDGRLFVTTREGRLYCFGERRVLPRTHRLPEAEKPLPDSWTEHARLLLERTGVREGYCVVLGADSGRLAQELALQSELRVIVIDPNAEKVEELRDFALDARLPAQRFSVIQADPDTVELPPYFANLLVVEELDADDPLLQPEGLRRAFSCLRPYGGLACLPLNADGQKQLLTALAGDALFKQAQVKDTDAGSLLIRAGALPGAANWTHENADAANTRVSKDQIVKAPLGLLWFGGTSHEGVLPRHGHGPQPQVVDGRVILEGMNMLRAVDIYTGRLLWESKFPGLGKVYDNLSHQPGANGSGTNYVSLPDGIYVALNNTCKKLQPSTGKEEKSFPVPRPPGERGNLTWAYLNVAGDYLIGGINPQPPKGTPIKGVEGSKYLFVMDRHSGKLLWPSTTPRGSWPAATAQAGVFRHNAICAGGGRLYAIDRPALDPNAFGRSPTSPPAATRLLAFDLSTGKEIWSRTTGVFGTWLSYSEKHDVLVESGRVARDTLPDEVRGMRAYRAGKGEVLWDVPGHAGPAMIHGDHILKDGSACELLTGKAVKQRDPLTGELADWTWTRTYGCNTPMASEHLLTFRSGAAGYYDLCDREGTGSFGCGGTGNFGGFRSGCTNNLVVAGGLLTAPDYTRTCTCSYQVQTSLALVPMAEAEMWTYPGSRGVTGVVRQAGILLGAPGGRLASNNTLWMEHPAVGGPGPRLAVQTVPATPEYFRRHSSQIKGNGQSWIAAAGARGLRTLTVPLAPAGSAERTYTVRLYFSEPDRYEPGDRIFSVALQGETVLEDLDICEAAGGPLRLLVKEFNGVRIGANLVIGLMPSEKADIKIPLLSGVEVVAEGW